MSSKLKYEVVAVTGKYKDRDGNEKPRHMKVGVVLEGDKGLSMKLEALPVTPEWDGWLRFYEPKPKEQTGTRGGGSQSGPASSGGPGPATQKGFDDEDIPF